MHTRGCGRRYFSIRGGFTVVEVLLVVAVLVVLAVVLIPQLGRHGCGSRQLKCSTQIRGMMQGVVIWGQSNGDRYPLPSIVDKANGTIALAPGEVPQSKDTSANILSLLIFNGYVPTEMCVTPSEANGNIKACEGYQFFAPTTAAKPDGALWDPAFNADFTGKKPGNLSYAHQLPLQVVDAAGSQPARWGSSPSLPRAVVGNRGPQITSVNISKTPPRAKFANPNSNTLLIHGGRSTWEGNIGFDDNHIDYNSATTLFEGHYLDAAGGKKPDCLFFDELDAGPSGNSFLGIFVKAGAARKDFVAIWD